LLNLERINAGFIKKGIERVDRLVMEDKIAKDQINSLIQNSIRGIEKLK